MRVLFVAGYYYPELEFGGPPKRLHALAKALIGRSHEVRVVTFDSRKPARRDVAAFDGVTVQYVSWLGRGTYQIPSRMRELAREVRAAEVVHCYGLYNFLCPLAANLSFRAGVPFALEPMGMFVPRERSLFSKRIYNATLTKWMAGRASAIVATSELEANELRELASTTGLVIRHNGIDLNEFENLPEGEMTRERWQVAPDDTLLVYFGRISSKKNLHDLVSAFTKADVPHSKLVIAGPVSESHYNRQLVDQIQASSRCKDIRLEGPLYGEELKAAFSAADLFVLPSLNENFGNAAGEAVAAGVPVLLSETCGIAPLIHKRAGLAVPLGVDNLAAGLRRIADPEQRKALVAQREDVKRDLSWDEPVAQTERLYEEIISGRNVRRTESVPDRTEETR
jgi:glycosyltransferase involved in cell wall biosynthesis